MAGADRVEGTLFGNGERTGNVDIITLGLNMFTQGVNPNLDFSDINELVETAEFCNQLAVPERHPYAGKLVHTAFSGSHQDAIRKGMDALMNANENTWEVPYLPIDPGDIGRTFEAIIRVNSQSGKAGAAYLLEADHHVRLPRAAEVEFSGIVQREADTTGKEITSQRIWELAQEHYIRPTGTFELVSFDVAKASRNSDDERVTATVMHNGKEVGISAIGNGPISAFVEAMRNEFDLNFRLADFGQNTREATSKAEAAAYVELVVENGNDVRSIFGVGIDTSITMAPIRAVMSALNKLKDGS
jgi:2-isopropylmalate synthase